MNTYLAPSKAFLVAFKLKNRRETLKDLIELVIERKGITQLELCRLLNISPATIKRAKGSLSGFLSDSMREKLRSELEKMIDAPIESEEMHSLRQERALYRTQERNRLLNKSNRDLKKSEFTYIDFLDGVVEAVGRLEKKDNSVIRFKKTTSGKSLIVQLSDLHLGSVVDLAGNKYSTEIAIDRLSQYFSVIQGLVKTNNVDEIVVVNSGDTISLDYRQEQLLSMESTRAESFISSLDVLTDFVDSLYKLGAPMRVISVLSNESRLKGYLEPSNSDKLAIDSFDYILHQSLKRIFKSSSIKFENECDTLEYLFTVQGKNILAMHGNTVKNHSDDSFTKVRLNTMVETNILLDAVICGHIHTASINAFWFRSGSLKGHNEYAKNKLTLTYTKPSQNIYLVDQERIIPMVIDFK
jgi:transcriptional regulator with XRE-family HTH domain